MFIPKKNSLEKNSPNSNIRNSIDDIEYKRTFLKTQKVSSFNSPSNKFKGDIIHKFDKDLNFDLLVKGKPIGKGLIVFI